MLSKDIARIVASGLGLVSLAALVYIAGPFISFGDWRPLENPIIREIIIAILVAAAAALAGFAFWRRRAKSKDIAKNITESSKADSDAEVLAERMKDALTTLKGAHKGKGNFLYDLPWYLLIGPPGAGKTTALTNSGLKFPLARGTKPAAVAGVGGTRYCDWWFAEDAVLIDTAGRYTTHDSDAQADQKSWLAFLDLLKKNRPHQPINGVIVAIGLDTIMTADAAATDADANAIRARLIELHQRLKVDFPVYVLLTKADLVAGFREYFSNLDEMSRKQVWGATFQTANKRSNMVGEVPNEFDALIARLNEMTTDRLQEEPVPQARVALFGLPAQLAKLKIPVTNFLNQIFEPTRYHANATLRGFYFASGTQEGTPIDQLIGALSRTFKVEGLTRDIYSGRGQSYFLTDLISKVMIGEAAWVSTDRAAVLRARVIKTAALCGLLLACAAASLAWWTSYDRNKELIEQTKSAAAEYRKSAGPLLDETEIADHDLAKILPPLNYLRQLPAGYGSRGNPVPIAATFGLSQAERLRSAGEAAYATALERILRPRLLYRLEEQLEANRTNPSSLYDALKAYLMLGGLHPPDPAFLQAYLRRDWADNLYPGAANSDGRRLLEEHFQAMLELANARDLLVTLDGPLIADTQATLARLSVAQRAYELLRSQASASDAPDWTPGRHGGPDVNLVFTTVEGGSLDTIRVPAFFTYDGFRRLFVERLGGVANQLRDNRWVLGSAGEQTAVEAQYNSLTSELLALYAKDFSAAWHDSLSKLKLKRLMADKPKYVALAAASAATSPIKQLLESVRDETALTRERPGFVSKGYDDLKATLLGTRAAVPGSEIEQEFKAYHILVEGEATRRPIDLVVANLADIYQNLLVSDSAAQGQQAVGQLQTAVASLRSNANRLPQPFAGMLQAAASEFDGELTTSFHAKLGRALKDQVTGICQQIVTNRYPFARSDREVPLADFGRLFAPQGAIDKFFTSEVAQYIDTSKQNWSWRQDTAIGRALASSTGTLREFQRAAQIRETFFATGGLLPSMTLTVVPPAIPSAPAAAAPGSPSPNAAIKMEINGTLVASAPGNNAPTVVQWPGAGTGHAAITVTTDQSQQPTVIERYGPWSLFRLVDAGAPVARGDKVVVSYILAGRQIQYQIGVGSVLNAFTLPALKEFHCPSEL
ncbi:MAG TPA: type VI secretion system membrane subunit TssM [Methylocella sp.]|nr:type VI secretion system membrane subunit TssM [Methylocella sp.]